MLDLGTRDAARGHVVDEGVAGVVDDVAVPAGADDGDALAVRQARGLGRVDDGVGGYWGVLIHGKSLVVGYQNQGFGEAMSGGALRPPPGGVPFSSIRTVTVGSGVAPDLLTPPP